MRETSNGLDLSQLSVALFQPCTGYLERRGGRKAAAAGPRPHQTRHIARNTCLSNRWPAQQLQRQLTPFEQRSQGQVVRGKGRTSRTRRALGSHATRSTRDGPARAHERSMLDWMLVGPGALVSVVALKPSSSNARNNIVHVHAKWT